MSAGRVVETPIRVDEVSVGSPGAEAAERMLDDAGCPVALSSRPTWIRRVNEHATRILIARDTAGVAVGLLALSRVATRALPGHHVVRIEAVGDSLATPAGGALLVAAARLSRREARVLRLVVEVECRSESSRRAIGDVLSREGFRRIPNEVIPAQTLVVDLSPGVEEILGGFSRSTRQNIRGAAKAGLETAPLVDAALSGRMNALLAESLSRTGGEVQSEEWGHIMSACEALPSRARLIGVFRGSRRDAEGLVGFAWGLHHGDRVEYHTGASARIRDVRLPILYPALWDLIVWGRSHGGRWFDLGGVSGGSVGSDDALGGISDFKRGFSKDVVPIGEEWVLEPSAIKSKIAAVTSGLARQLRTWRRR